MFKSRPRVVFRRSEQYGIRESRVVPRPDQGIQTGAGGFVAGKGSEVGNHELFQRPPAVRNNFASSNLRIVRHGYGLATNSFTRFSTTAFCSGVNFCVRAARKSAPFLSPCFSASANHTQASTSSCGTP